MAPGYRANNQSRRQNRGYVDHDVFEGLPVRNWRRDVVTVAPPPTVEVAQQKDKWDVELPWGMPKDSHLLPQHSQDLLRAARSGRLYVKRKAVEEEEVETENATAEKPEKKELDPKEDGFSVKTWKLVPRHQEGPEAEYLAKRRKIIKTNAAPGNVVTGPAMTKATVRRIDAAGNAYVQDLVVPEGQNVEGEVIAQIVVNNPSATASTDAFPAQPTPPRRRPPPPKRKPKGPGRGRKRKLPLPPTSVPSEGAANGQIQADGSSTNAVGPDGEALEGSAAPTNENDDTEMGDDTGLPSDEEGDEDGEEGEDGDEGDEDDDQEGDGEDGMDGDEDVQGEEDGNQATEFNKLDSTGAPISRPPGHAVDNTAFQHQEGEATYDTSYDTTEHDDADSSGLNGSPLKQVINQATFPPELDNQPPEFSDSAADMEMEESTMYGNPEGTEAEDIQVEVDMSSYDNPDSGMAMQRTFQPVEEQNPTGDAFESAPHFPQSMEEGVPQNTATPVIESNIITTATENEGEDEMLLDQVADVHTIGLPLNNKDGKEEHIIQETVTSVSIPVSAPEPPFNPGEYGQPQTQAGSASLLAAPEAPEAEEDKFEDLLGSLENHLDASGTNPIPPPAEEPVAVSQTEEAKSAPAEIVEVTTITAVQAQPEPENIDEVAKVNMEVVAKPAMEAEAQLAAPIAEEAEQLEPEPAPKAQLPEPESAKEEAP